MRKGKYHTRRILKSIRVRALSAITAFTLVGVVPAFFNVGYNSAKAAYVKTVDHESTTMPLPKKASYAQVNNVSRERFSPLTQNFILRENHNSWYETKYQNKSITASHADETVATNNVQLQRDSQEEYYMINNELVQGYRIVIGTSNTLLSDKGGSYYLSWEPTGKVTFNDAESSTIKTTYSKRVSRDVSATATSDVSNLSLDIKYDNAGLYSAKNKTIDQFAEYNPSYLWEKRNLVLDCNEINSKDSVSVSVAPIVDGNATGLSIENGKLVYRTTLTGYGVASATESSKPSFKFLKKSDLDRFIAPAMDSITSLTSSSFEQMMNRYALAKFNMPFLRDDTVDNFSYRQDANATTGLFWDGSGFYAMAFMPTCYVYENNNWVSKNTYTFKYRLKTNKVNPSDTKTFSGNVTYKYDNSTVSSVLKYQHTYNENNKKSFTLTYDADVNYYSSYPDYYYSYVDTNVLGEFVPYDDTEEDKIVYLDKGIAQLNLPGIKDKKIVDISPNTKYRITYEDLPQKDNQYISALLYAKNDLYSPIMYARLNKITNENGEVTFSLPGQISDGDYIIGFFTEYLEGVDAQKRSLNRMSEPVFCEMTVGNANVEDLDDGEFRYEKAGSINNPLLARDKYGIWWNYTSVKKYKEDTLIDEFIDSIWMPSEHNAFIKSINQALADPLAMNGKLVLPSHLTNEKLPVRGIGGGTRETVILPSEINDFSEIIFPINLEAINDYAFYECRSNYELNLPSTIKSIGKYAFAYNNIRDILAEGQKLSVDSYAFMKNEMLQSVHMDYDNELSIGYRAFFQCKNIRQRNDSQALYLSADKLILDKQSFASSMQSNMGANTTIISKNGLIGVEAFKNAMNYADKMYMSKLNLNEFKGEICANAFNGASGIKSLYITNGCILDEYAFNNLGALTKLQCDASIVTDNSFCSCPEIVDIIFGENVARVCSNWLGSDVSNVSIPEVNIAILSSDTRFEFDTSGNNIYSSFGVSKSDNGFSRIIDTVNLFYNASNIARTAQMNNGKISDNIHALNMSNVEFSDKYKASGGINNIIWIPSDQFNLESFGYKAINGEISFEANEINVKAKNIYAVYNDNNKAMNNTELKKELFKVCTDNNMLEEFCGDWYILPRATYKLLDINTKVNRELLSNVPGIDQVYLSDTAIDVAVVGFLDDEVYKGTITVYGLTPTETLEEEFGDIGLVYEKIVIGEEALVKLEQVNSKLNESIETINTLNNDIAASNDEITRLTVEIEEKNLEIGRLQETSTENSAEIILLQKEAEAKNQEILQLNELINRKTSELEQASNEASSYTEEISKLNKQIDDYVISISGKDNEINLYMLRIDDLQKENTQLKNLLASIQQTETTENNSKNEDDVVSNNDDSISDINSNDSSELIRLSAELNQARNQIALIKNENDSLKAASALLEKENDTLRSNTTALEKENNTLKSNASVLEKENNTLKSNTTALEKENNTLKSNASVLEKENNILKVNATALEKENVILKANVSELEKDKDDLNVSNDKLSTDIMNLSGENQKLKNQRDNLKGNVNDWKDKYNELKDNSSTELKDNTQTKTDTIKTELSKTESILTDNSQIDNQVIAKKEQDSIESDDIADNNDDDRIYYTGIDMDGNTYSYYITDDGEIIYDDGIDEFDEFIDEDNSEAKYPNVLPTDITVEDMSYTSQSNDFFSESDAALMDEAIMDDNEVEKNEVPVGKIILGIVLVAGVVAAVIIISKRRKITKNQSKK